MAQLESRLQKGFCMFCNNLTAHIWPAVFCDLISSSDRNKPQKSPAGSGS